MVYKIKTPMKKIGGSYYALIPAGLIQELDLYEDGEVLAEFEKYRDVVFDLCNKFCTSGENVIINSKDKEDLEGVIMFVNKLSIDFLSGDKTYVIPFNHIKELKETEVKNE